ncbi:DUF6221 family protein [Xylanimonas sp. McL0601]|uniref:DUF6221 family protein n=1 Tax=Xylanimonas sp. McL0601 TaxID=3414739 RepID=UPI003CEF3055
MTIVEFLRARIAEDEEAARGVLPRDGGDAGLGWGPERVLIECEAKRRIVEHVIGSGWSGYLDDPDFKGDGWAVLVNLAAPFTSHPDYDEQWSM